MVNDKRCDPCNSTLSDHHCERPFPAQFSLYGSNRRYTGRKEQQKIKRESAAGTVRETRSASVDPNNTLKVDTTLSFAIKPEIRAVQILQSPNPNGMKRGAIHPAIIARILFCESDTILNCKSKLCKNQMMIVAMKITVKALCRKSFALSQSRWTTFFTPGIR